MYFLWHFDPRVSNVISTELTYGQNEVLVTSLPNPESKVINPRTGESFCSQSSHLAWSQGLLSALSGGRMRSRPLKMQAEQAHLIAKHCQVWAHICRVQANLKSSQEPHWFQLTVQENKPGPGWGLCTLLHSCLYWVILSTFPGQVLPHNNLLSPTQCLGTLNRQAQTLDFPKYAVWTRLLCFGEKRSMDQVVPLLLRTSTLSLGSV